MVFEYANYGLVVKNFTSFVNNLVMIPLPYKDKTLHYFCVNFLLNGLESQDINS